MSCVLNHSVVSDSLQPYGLLPTRLLFSTDSPGKNTVMGCHALPPGDLCDPGIEPASLTPPELADGFFTTKLLGKF